MPHPNFWEVESHSLFSLKIIYLPKARKYTGGSRIFFLHINHNILILPSTCWCSLDAQSLLEFQNMFLVRVCFQLPSLFVCFQGLFCSLQTSKKDQHLVNDFQVSMSPSIHSLCAYKTNSRAVSRTVTSTGLNILGIRVLWDWRFIHDSVAFLAVEEKQPWSGQSNKWVHLLSLLSQ